MFWYLWPRWRQTLMSTSTDAWAVTSGFQRGSDIILKHPTICISFSIFIPLLGWVFLHTCTYAYLMSENLRSEMLWNSIFFCGLHKYYISILLQISHIHNPEIQKFWAPTWWNKWKILALTLWQVSAKHRSAIHIVYNYLRLYINGVHETYMCSDLGLDSKELIMHMLV